jgi:hypothetical protein
VLDLSLNKGTAMETTYDPILGGPDQLPYMQVRALPPPQLGTALVLISSRGDLVTCRAGAPVPSIRFGNYRTAYYIDVTEHQLVLDAQLPSSASGFVFYVHLTYRCRVIDAARVADRQIRDVGELLGPRLTTSMRVAARRIDISDTSDAEEAVHDALTRGSFDPSLEITVGSVEFPVHADEAADSSRTIREAHRTNRLNEIKVGPMRKLLAGGSPDLLALHLATHPEDTGPTMEMIVAGDMAEAQNMLQAISIMYGRDGGEEEPFESRDERKRLMERFLSRALPTGGGRYISGPGAHDRHDDGPRGGSRLRGSLSRGSRDEHLAISAEVVDHGHDEPYGADGRRSDPSPRSSAPDPAHRRREPSSRRDPDADDEG